MTQSSAEQGDPHDAFASILLRADGAPIATAVIHPVSQNALAAALDAQATGLIKAVLVGPEKRIRAAADQFGLDLAGAEIIDTPHSHAAAQTGVDLARAGKVHALMKGALHTNELMAAIVARNTGLRTDRRMSHVFVMHTPAYPKYLLISDGALNIAPDLHTKRWIVQNAVPNIEAGNMLAKQLDYLAGAAAAGLVVGAQVPIILTSRSDSVRERLASCALAKCYLAWKASAP